MNLHKLARGVVGAVNPNIDATLLVSTGYTTNADGRRVPVYAAPRVVSCQVQALQYGDLAQLDGLNIQGIKRKIYVNGRWDATIRSERKGGDLVVLPNGDTYLVVLVLEYWPDWCCVAVTLQDRA